MPAGNNPSMERVHSGRRAKISQGRAVRQQALAQILSIFCERIGTFRRQWSNTQASEKENEEMVTFTQTLYPRRAASFALVLAGLVSAQSSTPRPEFEVASIKPNTAGNNLIMIPPPVGGRFRATNVRLQNLIGIAYNVKPSEISGGPSWMSSEGFDIEAKAADSNAGIEQIRPMMQSLLADRFKLAAHKETKEVPVYALTAAKNGPKLPDAKEGGCVAFGPDKPPPLPAPGQRPPTPCGGFFMGPNHMEAGKVGMEQLARALSNILGRPVIDKTGFTGTFDVKLDFSPEGTNFGGRGGFGPPPGAPGDGANPDALPSIFTAIQDQLGLKLESQKGTDSVLVIDHAERPSEN
jgi:bla regulator protein blaR1